MVHRLCIGSGLPDRKKEPEAMSTPAPCQPVLPAPRAKVLKTAHRTARKPVVVFFGVVVTGPVMGVSLEAMLEAAKRLSPQTPEDGAPCASCGGVEEHEDACDLIAPRPDWRHYAPSQPELPW
jgi:hypothetical protein